MRLDHGHTVRRPYLSKCPMTVSEGYNFKSTMVKERPATSTHVANLNAQSI